MTSLLSLPRTFLPVFLCAPVLLSAQAPAPAAPAAPSTTSATAPAAGPTLTDEQTANIMKQLEALETQISKSRGDVLGGALAKFKAASASTKDALDLYLDCYRLEHFERRDLKATEFQTWKDSREVQLKDEEFLTGLQLQLEYLVITLQAQSIEETKDMGPVIVALQAFMPKAVAAIQETIKHTASGAIEAKNQGGKGGGKGGGGGRPPGGGGGGGSLSATLRQDVKSSEFSQAYLLTDYLTRKDWCYTPMNIAEIYDATIIPYYLEVKPEEVSAQWDARNNGELALRKFSMSESEYAVYFKERQPELAWRKAAYMLQNKLNPILAMADMLKIVRENPTHAQAGTWLKQLRQAVNSAQPGAVSSPGAAAAAAASAPATN